VFVQGLMIIGTDIEYTVSATNSTVAQ